MKNDDDLKLLVRLYNEYNHVPYREMDLDTLGKLPDFTCVSKSDVIPKEVAEEVSKAAFKLTREQQKRKKRNSPKKVARKVIFGRLSHFLDGFEVEAEESSDSEDENVPTEIPEAAAIQTNV